MDIYFLYQVTNLVNNKIYIGVHHCGPNCKRYSKCPYMGSGWVIKKALKKYGVDNFRKDVLGESLDKEFIYKLEEAVVDAAFIMRDDTYNLVIGGGPPPIPQKGRKHAKHSEETKARLRLLHKGNTYGRALKGIPFTEEHKQRISAALKGKTKSPEHCRKNGDAKRGIHPSEETKQKMRESRQRYLASISK